MKKQINKTVRLFDIPVNVNAYIVIGIFRHQAELDGWSEQEINIVLKEAQSQNFHHFLQTILLYSEDKNDTEVNPINVRETLYQLGLHTHYLNTKPIKNWDEYDHSNFRSLQIKAGKIKF
ncbi:hypothetical protein [Pontimicrobium sp. MEBiC01747]